MNKETLMKGETKLFFKSGDGESWIKPTAFTYPIRKERIQHELDGDTIQDLEEEFYHIVREHDHDTNSGRGYILLMNGKVTKSEYTSED